MDIPTHKKLSSHLVLTAALSGGITVTLSLIYILLCTAALIFKFTECESPSIDGQLFWTIVSGTFFRDTLGKPCELDLFDIPPAFFDITPAYTVFVLAAITLAVSVLCLASASVLIATIQDERAVRYLNMVVSAYVGTSVASLVVDLTTAAHFGIDHSTLTSQLNSLPNTTSFEVIYVTEVVRQGAFLLMSIGLKGYVALLINWILIILLIVYVMEHRKLMTSAEHSIHKMGVLNAFDQLRKPDDNNWATNSTREPELYSPFARGAQVNNGFNDDESERGTRRTPKRSDTNYSNRSYDPSDTWHRGQPNRPFSYLEDIKRSAPVPARPPTSPAVEAPWSRRDQWQQPQGPPVPAPDYSPQPRRLKSALKPGGYM